MTITLSADLIGWLDFAITLGVSNATSVLTKGWTEAQCIAWLTAECNKAEAELYTAMCGDEDTTINKEAV